LKVGTNLSFAEAQLVVAAAEMTDESSNVAQVAVEAYSIS
jgi:hypothetical protein